MNNSKLAIDSVTLETDQPRDVKPELRQKEEKLTKIIEAIRGIEQSKDWSTLKIELFDELPKQLRKEMLGEARKENPDTHKLNRLSGELKWAEKFADLQKFEASQRVELSRIRLMLYGKAE